MNETAMIEELCAASFLWARQRPDDGCRGLYQRWEKPAHYRAGALFSRRLRWCL